MKKIYEYIVNHPKLILSVFMTLFVICSLCKPFVSVNYDMNTYLPEDTASTIALDKMHEEFTGGIPNARIMLNDVSVPEVLVYKDKIQNVDGVSDVTWLDNVTNIAQPLEIMDTETVKHITRMVMRFLLLLLKMIRICKPLMKYERLLGMRMQ